MSVHATEMIHSYDGGMMKSELTLVSYGGEFVGLDFAEVEGFLPFGESVIKCTHCGQWGARKCACKYCGAPIE